MGEENHEKLKKRCREYYANNLESAKIRREKFKKKNPNYARDNYYKDIEESRIRAKEYRQKNTERIKLYKKKYYNKNKEKARLYDQKRNEENPGYRNNYFKKRYQANPIYRLNSNITSAIYRSLKGNKNGRHWEAIVGYTLMELKVHLEKQFKNGMNWANKGRNGWHLDHKIPIEKFNITSIECDDFKRCWALENLQPMWEADNIRKSNKILNQFAQLKMMLKY